MPSSGKLVQVQGMGVEKNLSKLEYVCHLGIFRMSFFLILKTCHKKAECLQPKIYHCFDAALREEKAPSVLWETTELPAGQVHLVVLGPRVLKAKTCTWPPKNSGTWQEMEDFSKSEFDTVASITLRLYYNLSKCFTNIELILFLKPSCLQTLPNRTLTIRTLRLRCLSCLFLDFSNPPFHEQDAFVFSIFPVFLLALVEDETPKSGTFKNERFDQLLFNLNVNLLKYD